MTMTRYLQQVMKQTATGTPYAAAKLLKISPDAMYGYIEGRRIPDNLTCARIAEVTGTPLDELIASAEFERARDDETKKFWARYLRKQVALSLALLSLWTSAAHWDTTTGQASASDLVQIMRLAGGPSTGEGSRYRPDSPASRGAGRTRLRAPGAGRPPGPSP